MVVKQIKFIAATVKQAVNEFLADNCTHLSAAISYYILLSLFPLALAAITILGYFSRSPDIGARVTQAIADVLPGVRSSCVRYYPGRLPGLGHGRSNSHYRASLVWHGLLRCCQKIAEHCLGDKTTPPLPP